MRLVWRFSRNKKLIGGVLLVLSILFFIWTLFDSTSVDQALGETDVFYDDDHAHKFVVNHAQPFQRAVEDPVEFIPNRKRTLKTYYGVVQVKDLLFVPINPLKKSQSLLPRLSKRQDFDRPVIDLGLGSKSQGRGLAPLMPRPNSNTSSRLYSILQQLQKKREEVRGGKKEGGGRGQFLNSEKMLALQEQIRERESQSVKNDVKDGYFQKGGNVLKSLTNDARCKKQMCADFLTSYDLSHYRYCMKKAKIRYNKEPPTDFKCNFINGTMRDAVALASHRGSGHLWVRQLLQMSTGVCTGEVECDVKLRRSGFPGENLRSGVVLVVNTHQTQPTWTRVQEHDSIRFNQSIDIPVFGSAVLLIRDPFDAFADLWQHLNGKGTISGENKSVNHASSLSDKHNT